MNLKKFFAEVANWLQAHKLSAANDYHPEVDDEGFIADQTEPLPEGDKGGHETGQNNHVVVKTVGPKAKQESIEKLQEGFNSLIEQLQGINVNLGRQVAQHEDLMSRIEQLPKLLESLPAVVENQRQTAQQLTEQLKMALGKQEQFIDTVQKIPTETAKQTDALVSMNHQLGAAADTDVQMVDNFNKFNESLDKLNQRTDNQTDSIIEMSKTFATSDRYLKYILSRQNRRFIWVFVIAMGVCLAAIVTLAGIIIYLGQR
jgi:hypothetical protein